MASPTLEAAIGGDLEETTSTTPEMVHQLVRRARGAQAVFEQFPQQRVDAPSGHCMSPDDPDAHCVTAVMSETALVRHGFLSSFGRHTGGHDDFPAAIVPLG